MASLIGSIAGPLIGGLLGSQSTTSSTQHTLPDYLKAIITGSNGSGGLLNDVAALQRQQSATGGLNPLQSAGIEAQRQFLTSPLYSQGFNQMRGQGMDLMGRSVAENPFTNGGAQLGSHLNNSAGMPAPNTYHPQSAAWFDYTMNPQIQGALQPTAQNANSPSANTTAATQIAPTIDQILAELARQQQQGPTTNGAGA